MTHHRYRVRLYWDLDIDVYRTSKIVTRLCTLHTRGLVRFEPRIGIDREETGRPGGEVFARCEVESVGDRKSILIAFDLHDLSTQFYEEALQVADIYFKKSYYPPDIVDHAPNYTHKILPYGFNMPCASNLSKRVAIGWLMRLYARMALRAPRTTLERWRRSWGTYRVFIDGPILRDFEQSSSVPKEPRVVFQTHVWSPEEVGPDNHEIVNQLRVDTIRRLRTELGERFVGGLVPTALAREKYPDILAVAPKRRSQFIRWSKRFLVGVYVRGLNYSYGFRFAEHLAASQCVVAHPDGFRNPSPVPVREGVHYLPFQTPDESVTQCRRLLADRDLAQQMRRANEAYYLAEIEPAAHMLRGLERAFEHIRHSRG